MSFLAVGKYNGDFNNLKAQFPGGEFHFDLKSVAHEPDIFKVDCFQDSSFIELGTNPTLERLTRPLVLEKKPIYSNRSGSGTNYEFIYHPTEKTHRETLFRWENNGWTEMDLSFMTR